MIRIKPKYSNTVIAFRGSGIALGKRTQEDLLDLGLLAHGSQDPSILALFENLPTEALLKKQKMTQVEKAIK